MLPEVGGQRFRLHPVNARAAFVLPYPRERLPQVCGCKHPLHQSARSRASGVACRRRLFPAPQRLRGFTPGPLRPLQLPGHLGPFPAEIHGRLALPSVRPFPRPVLWPLLTSRSASPRRPFSRKARPPQVRPQSLPRTTAGSTPSPLTAGASRSFARSPAVGASYPVPVRRPAPLAPRFLQTPVARMPLRFAHVGGSPPSGTPTRNDAPMLGAQTIKAVLFARPFDFCNS